MKSEKTVRIGGACGFLGDTSISTPQLIGGGDVDYIVYDYLAEVTMSLLARVKAKRPDMGYAHYFTDVIIEENIKDISEKGIRIITNAGGVNPNACRDKILEIAKNEGIEIKVVDRVATAIEFNVNQLHPKLPQNHPGSCFILGNEIRNLATCE